MWFGSRVQIPHFTTMPESWSDQKVKRCATNHSAQEAHENVVTREKNVNRIRQVHIEHSDLRK